MLTFLVYESISSFELIEVELELGLEIRVSQLPVQQSMNEWINQWINQSVNQSKIFFNLGAPVDEPIWTTSMLDCKGRGGVWKVKFRVNKGFFPLFWIKTVWQRLACDHRRQLDKWFWLYRVAQKISHKLMSASSPNIDWHWQWVLFHTSGWVAE